MCLIPTGTYYPYTDNINIENLLNKADTLIIGGGMAYTFFKANGHSVGTSLCEDDKVELAKEMMAKAKAKGINFLIPVDNKLGKEYDENTESMFCDSTKIPDGWMGLDIGPKTQELFANAIKGAGTVVWNGPMGVFENPTLAVGTIAVAKALAETDATTIIGGGDVMGAVVLLTGDKNSPPTQTDIKLTQVAAGFLGKQMEE